MRLLENVCRELVNQIFRKSEKIMATVVSLWLEGRMMGRPVRKKVPIFLHFVRNA